MSTRNPAPIRAGDRSSPIGRSRPDVRLTGPGAAKIAEIAGAVPDPELPMVSLAHLGVLRAVDVEPGTGAITVIITPTYSGCPATAMMSTDVADALRGAGYPDVTVRKELTGAWSSDDLTVDAHTALRDSGIAPPTGAAAGGSSYRASSYLREQPVVPCPHCGSRRTTELSQFGSTSCKALYRCDECREPFDYFKVH